MFTEPPPTVERLKASSLLIQEHLESFSPSLAVAIGLNEAIVLQKIHSWVRINQTRRQTYAKGYYWTYNTLVAWQAALPWWSLKTIQRTLKELQERKILIAEPLMDDRRDRTLWYRIDHSALDATLIDEMEQVFSDSSPIRTESPNARAQPEKDPIRTDCPDAPHPDCPDASNALCPDVYKEQLLLTTTTPITTLPAHPSGDAGTTKTEPLFAPRARRVAPPGVTKAPEAPKAVEPTAAEVEDDGSDWLEGIETPSVPEAPVAAPVKMATTPPVSSPPIAAAPPAPKAKKVGKAKAEPKYAPGVMKAMTDAMVELCYPGGGVTASTGRTAGVKAAELLDAGYTLEDLTEIGKFMRADAYWRGKGISPGAVVTQAPIWKAKSARSKPKAKVAAPEAQGLTAEMQAEIDAMNAAMGAGTERNKKMMGGE